MLAIGEWTIDTDKALVFKQDQPPAQPLQEKALKVLLYLSDNQRIVTSQELLEQFWPADSDENSSEGLSELKNTINQIGQVMDSSVINSVDEGGYLLTLPVYKYNYQPVSFAETKAKLQRQQLSQITRKTAMVKAESPTAKPVSNQTIITRVLIGMVIIAVIYVVNL
ncbi:MAG: response regulator transcription factor [Algicola sp.]|nr:response regulator transcription factor [Algicola sp.]